MYTKDCTPEVLAAMLNAKKWRDKCTRTIKPWTTIDDGTRFFTRKTSRLEIYMIYLIYFEVVLRITLHVLTSFATVRRLDDLITKHKTKNTNYDMKSSQM